MDETCTGGRKQAPLSGGTYAQLFLRALLLFNILDVISGVPNLLQCERAAVHSRADRLTTTPAPAVAQCKRASTVVELASSNGSHTGLLAITKRTSSEGGVNGGVNGGVKGGVKGGREDSPVR